MKFRSHASNSLKISLVTTMNVTNINVDRGDINPLTPRRTKVHRNFNSILRKDHQKNFL